MEPDIRPPGLLAGLDRELVAVGRKVADSIHGGGGTVRDDALLGGPLPRRNLWGQLEPRGAQLQVIGLGRSGEPVDTVRHPLQRRTLPRQPVKGRLRDAGLVQLTARDQAPLVFCDPGNPGEGGSSHRYCIIP